jgi:serine/threonine-protein kinase RsbW
MTVSFPSTLHLHPILDVLLARIPENCHSEVRLGLQEALVNAAKHGNNLDPSKSISIRFRATPGGYCWIISDQGPGFHPEADHPERNGYCCPEAVVFPEVDPAAQRQTGDPPEACEREAYERDCGRGLYILHHIFDQVEWSPDGKELMLYKRTNRWFFPSLFWNS